MSVDAPISENMRAAHTMICEAFSDKALANLLRDGRLMDAWRQEKDCPPPVVRGVDEFMIEGTQNMGHELVEKAQNGKEITRAEFVACLRDIAAGVPYMGWALQRTIQGTIAPLLPKGNIVGFHS